MMFMAQSSRSSVDYREHIAHLEGKPNFHLHYANLRRLYEYHPGDEQGETYRGLQPGCSEATYR